MDISQFYIAIIIGTVLSLLVEEFFGISCGGIIVPGYMAMVCDDIGTVLVMFAISFLTYLIVNYGFARIMILFGKRKFTVTLLVALLLNVVARLCYPALAAMPFSSLTFRGVGAVTPALLANTYSKQGIKYTIPACIAVTAVTFGIMRLFA